MGMKDSMGPINLYHRYDDYVISGDIACCRGLFTLKDDSGQLKGEGK